MANSLSPISTFPPSSQATAGFNVTKRAAGIVQNTFPEASSPSLFQRSLNSQLEQNKPRQLGFEELDLSHGLGGELLEPSIDFLSLSSEDLKDLSSMHSTQLRALVGQHQSGEGLPDLLAEDDALSQLNELNFQSGIINSDLGLSLNDGILKSSYSSVLNGSLSLAYGAASNDAGTGLGGAAFALTEGSLAMAEGSLSLAEGSLSLAEGSLSLAEGSFGIVKGSLAAAEGSFGVAEGSFGVAEGSFGVAEGSFGVAEGSVGLVVGSLDSSSGLYLVGSGRALGLQEGGVGPALSKSGQPLAASVAAQTSNQSVIDGTQLQTALSDQELALADSDGEASLSKTFTGFSASLNSQITRVSSGDADFSRMMALNADASARGEGVLAGLGDSFEDGLELGLDKSHIDTGLKTASAVVSAANSSTAGLNTNFASEPGRISVPVNVSFGSEKWSSLVAERTAALAGQNIKSADIQLDPPELGPLTVKIHVAQDQASVTFSSPHAVVRDALDQTLVRLKEMMQEQGMDLVDSGVSDFNQGQTGADSGANEGESSASGDQGLGVSHMNDSTEESALNETGSTTLNLGIDYFA